MTTTPTPAALDALRDEALIDYADTIGDGYLAVAENEAGDFIAMRPIRPGADDATVTAYGRLMLTAYAAAGATTWVVWSGRSLANNLRNRSRAYLRSTARRIDSARELRAEFDANHPLDDWYQALHAGI